MSLPFTTEQDTHLPARRDDDGLEDAVLRYVSETTRKLQQYAADSDALARQHAEAIADGGYSTVVHHTRANGSPFTLCGLQKFTPALGNAKQRIERSTFINGTVTCAECLTEIAAMEAEASARAVVCGGCGRGVVANDGDCCSRCEDGGES